MTAGRGACGPAISHAFGVLLHMFRHWLRVGLLVLAGLVSSGAYATCYQWSVTVPPNATSTLFDTPQQAANAWTAACNNGTGVVGSVNCISGVCSAGAPCTSFSSTCSFTSFPTVTCALSYVQAPHGTINTTGPTVGSSARVACPNCPAAGTNTFYGLDAITTATGTSQICHDGCAYTPPAPPLVVCGGPSCSSPTGGVVESSATGNPCGQDPNSTPVQSDNNDRNDCDSSGTVCHSGDNCGTFNGDEVCVHTIAPGTCVSYASGGMACAGSGTSGNTFATPPDPGTGSTPATPNGQVVTTNQTINYYSATTVAGAGSGGTASNPIQSQPNGTQGSSSGGGTGSGTVTISGAVGIAPNAGNGDCGASGVNCTGDGSTPAFPSQDTVGDTTNNYWSSISGAPIVAAVSAISASVPSGSCPTAAISVFGSSYTIDEQCTLYADIAPLLSAVFLAMWTLLGVRILMSA